MAAPKTYGDAGFCRPEESTGGALRGQECPGSTTKFTLAEVTTDRETKRGGSPRLPQHPRRHRPQIFHQRGLQRIEPGAAEATGDSTEHPLVGEETPGAVRQQVPTAVERLEAPLHADRRSQSREEETSGTQDAPQLVQHPIEVRLVPGEMEHSVAEHRVKARVWKREVRQIRRLEALRRQVRRQCGGEAADLLHRPRVLVHTEDLVPATQEPDQVPASSTARVQQAHARNQPPLQELVEQIDVDVPQLLAQIHGGPGYR